MVDIAKKARERSRAYRKTPKGISVRLYHHQCQSSKKRKHPMPSYTREELSEWLSNHPKFQTLYDEWVKSEYSKDKSISIDRVNDNLPYSFNNITLTDWETNNIKGRTCHREGKIRREIIQYTREGNYVKTFPNAVSAAVAMNCSTGEITRCCKKRRPTCKNYVWRYKDEC